MFLIDNLSISSDPVNISHAFILTYFNLYRAADPSKKIRRNFYYETIKTIVILGGDTDTNASVVGSMIGALLGFDVIPKYNLNKVLKLDYKLSCKPRPKFLSIQENCLSNIETLLYIRPKPG